MKITQRIQVVVFLLGLAGCGLFIALLLRYGVPEIVAAMSTAGRGGVLVVAIHSLPLLLDTLSWQVLFPAGVRPPLGSLLWMRWVSEAINTLLPTAQLG